MVDKVIDLTDISNSYIKNEKLIIQRSNYIELIDDLFSKEEIVLLDGSSGSGITTLLKEFCELHNYDGISLFIDYSPRLTNDLENIKRDIGNQINWILNGMELSSQELLNVNINHLNYNLQRKSKNSNNKFYYFIIDGIEKIPLEEKFILDTLFDEILPFGVHKNFKFLLSDNSDGSIMGYLAERRRRHKSVTLAGFTNEETKNFFMEHNELSVEEIEEIRKLCKGKPGLLENFKRLIKSKDLNINELLNNLDKLPDFYDIEWEKIDHSNEIQVNIISLIIFDNRKHTIQSISEILNVKEEIIIEEINKIEFLECIDFKYSIYSNHLKTFLKNKLNSNKKRIDKIIIDDLITKSDYVEKLEYLPFYLNDTENYKILVELLNYENYNEILEKTQSLLSIKHLTEIGYNASVNLSNHTNAFKFGLQNSIMNQNYKSQIWNSEVKALISLNEFEKAISLANSNLLVEDRFHMYAIISKYKIKKGLSIEEEITNQLKNLYSKLDIKNLKSRALTIASDLIYTDVELAIKLIEESLGVKKNENSLDMAIAKVSLSALENVFDDETKFELVQNKINDDTFKRFLNDFYLYIKEKEGKKILSEVKNFSSTSDQITLLANWCLTNKIMNEGIDLIKYAFELINQTPNYSPNAGIYNKLSTQLKFMEKEEDIENTIKLFESQIEVVEKLGPRLEYINLRLNIIRGLYKCKKKNVYEHIEETYFYISEINEITVKTEGLSLLYLIINEIDSKKEFEKKENFHSLIEEELSKCIKIIIDNSADHFDELSFVINTLCSVNFDYTIAFINNMNTQTNRELSWHSTIKGILENKIDNCILDKSLKLLHKINVSNDLFSDALLKIILSVAEEKDFNLLDDKLILDLIELIKQMDEVELRCVAYCEIYEVIDNKIKLRSHFKKLLINLKQSWENIDISWRKIDIGFKISSDLSKFDLNISKEYLQMTEEYRNDLIFYDPNFAASYVKILKLLIRSYHGLISNKRNSINDLKEIQALISLIPSSGEQAILWSELIIKLLKNKDFGDAQKIYSENLKLSIDKINDKDSRYKNHVISIVAPSLYNGHKALAIEQIKNLSQVFSDKAYDNICTFIFTKLSPYEPRDTTFTKGSKLSYTDFIDLLEVIELIKNDNLAAYRIIELLESFNNSDSLSEQQKADILSKTTELINNCFPKKNYIQHDGYKIMCMSYLYGIKKKQKIKKEKWIDLISQSNEIVNISDRIFTKVSIVKNLPSREKELYKKTLEVMEEEIKTIPTLNDKISRYEHLAKELIGKDSSKSRYFLRKAMELTLSDENTEDETITSKQKNLIDLSYRINKEFAESLVSLTDDDPVKESIRMDMKKELNTQTLRQSTIDNKKIKELELDSYQYVDASWRLLGSLNAERMGTVLSLEESVDFLNVASKLSFTKAYPIYCWIIENSNLKKESSKKFQNDKTIGLNRYIFDYLLISAKFALSINSQNKMKLGNVDYSDILSTKNSIVIRPGERDKAIEYIKAWCEEFAEDFIKISDPYFCIKELEFIQILRILKPELRFDILTSKKQQSQEGIKSDFEDYYLDYWKIHITDQSPPETNITIAGTRSTGESPVHDRWILSKNSGLRVGTSLNSLGSKESDISILTSEEVKARSIEIDGYISTTNKVFKGEKLKFDVFSL